MQERSAEVCDRQKEFQEHEGPVSGVGHTDTLTSWQLLGRASKQGPRFNQTNYSHTTLLMFPHTPSPRAVAAAATPHCRQLPIPLTTRATSRTSFVLLIKSYIRLLYVYNNSIYTYADSYYIRMQIQVPLCDRILTKLCLPLMFLKLYSQNMTLGTWIH